MLSPRSSTPIESCASNPRSCDSHPKETLKRTSARTMEVITVGWLASVSIYLPRSARESTARHVAPR